MQPPAGPKRSLSFVCFLIIWVCSSHSGSCQTYHNMPTRLPADWPARSTMTPERAFNPAHPQTYTIHHPGLFDKTNAWVVLSLGTAASISRRFERDKSIPQRIDRSGLDFVMDFADQYGGGVTLGLTALGFMALGGTTSNPQLTQAGTELTSSLMAAAGITWALKISFDRRRPNGGSYSFPSGHTSTAFAAAPVLYRNFGPLIGSAAYTMAVMTGISRMEDNKHYMTDVFAGAIIGIVAGRTLSYQSPIRL
ncbi:MAG: phosphatase PAP2 family protein, partial [Candidatus Eisenbacteria bacterium]|nr:phosphatase PAP2 family protein [Candidatus Eisenbacteria bacterium]